MQNSWWYVCRWSTFESGEENVYCTDQMETRDLFEICFRLEIYRLNLSKPEQTDICTNIRHNQTALGNGMNSNCSVNSWVSVGNWQLTSLVNSENVIWSSLHYSETVFKVQYDCSHERIKFCSFHAIIPSMNCETNKTWVFSLVIVLFSCLNFFISMTSLTALTTGYRLIYLIDML